MAMQPFQAIVLGVIQGLTEFLPISSSGHLVLCQHFFGLTEPELVFDVSVHVGTLAAVVFYFRRELWRILLAVGRGMVLLLKRDWRATDVLGDSDMKMALLIVVGSLPTVALGLLFSEMAEQLFSSVRLVGVTLLITGGLLWMTRRSNVHMGRGVSECRFRDALVIGFTQGLAISPGISRSGSTISVGLLLGLQRETAARFSFLLSIPAILGAATLMAVKVNDRAAFVMDVTLIGTAISCVVGYAALWLLVYLVKQGKMFYFSPYCWVVGLMALISG